MAKVNDSGMQRKLKLMEEGLNNALMQLPRDAVAFYHGKLSKELLNKAKNSPHGAVGNGIIRRITGNLQRSINMKPISLHKWALFGNLHGPAGAYILKVWTWSVDNYGFTPMQFVRMLYDSIVIKGIQDELKRFAAVWDTKGKYEYQNPFPKT